MTAARKPQHRKAQTRETLIASAMEIVAAVGVRGLRVDVLVARANVAKGTFFAHFEDREHLIACLVAGRLVTLLSDANTRAGSLAGLRQMLQPTLSLMAEDLQVIGAMIRFSVPREGDVTGMYQALCAQAEWLTNLLADLQQRGLIRQDHDAALLADAVQAFLLQAAVAAACDTADPQDRLGDLLTALLSITPPHSPLV